MAFWKKDSSTSGQPAAPAEPWTAQTLNPGVFEAASPHVACATPLALRIEAAAMEWQLLHKLREPVIARAKELWPHSPDPSEDPSAGYAFDGAGNIPYMKGFEDEGWDDVTATFYTLKFTVEDEDFLESSRQIVRLSQIMNTCGNQLAGVAFCLLEANRNAWGAYSEWFEPRNNKLLDDSIFNDELPDNLRVIIGLASIEEELRCSRYFMTLILASIDRIERLMAKTGD